MTSVAAAMIMKSMSITITTTMMRSAAVAMTMIMKSMSTIITMTESAVVAMIMKSMSITITTTESVAVDMTTTIIMQMRSSQAGAVRLLKNITREGLEKILEALSESDKYGIILRAKGMLPAEDGTWIYFDMVPEETEIREGAPEYTGRLCVIGSKLDEHALEELFGIA